MCRIVRAKQLVATIYKKSTESKYTQVDLNHLVTFLSDSQLQVPAAPYYAQRNQLINLDLLCSQ